MLCKLYTHVPDKMHHSFNFTLLTLIIDNICKPLASAALVHRVFHCVAHSGTGLASFQRDILLLVDFYSWICTIGDAWDALIKDLTVIDSEPKTTIFYKQQTINLCQVWFYYTSHISIYIACTLHRAVIGNQSTLNESALHAMQASALPLMRCTRHRLTWIDYNSQITGLNSCAAMWCLLAF